MVWCGMVWCGAVCVAWWRGVLCSVVMCFLLCCWTHFYTPVPVECSLPVVISDAGHRRQKVQADRCE